MNKEEQVRAEFRDVFNKMAWLNGFRMEEALKGFKSSEVHCIEYIGQHTDANVTKLAEAFYMTRGALSKVAKKLLAKGIIDSYQKPGNKKEIYFRLTAQGQEVFERHERLHREFQKRDKDVFSQVTDEQFDDMLRFVERYRKHLDAEIAKLG